MSKQGTLDVEREVRLRYQRAASKKEPSLCCPVEYDPRYLEVLPQEILERDYGCGDPSRYVREGDTVLDLGSGAGKICYITAQIAGPKGKVIGVDSNTEMLALAEKHRAEIARRLGYANVTFRRARIQDLALPLDEVEAYLAAHAVRSFPALEDFQAYCRRLRRRAPVVPSESVDIVISNCVLNLVEDEDKPALFAETFRVLKRGGRAAVCDIVADEDVPEELKQDPGLWTGCLSGAFREDKFLEAFEQAGFHGIHVDKYDLKPWRTIRGIQFRSATVVAFKGKQGPCRERNQAVIYRGPWKKVGDDDGHVLFRGKRMAVCDKTYRLLTSEPYAQQVVGVPPLKEIPLEKAQPFQCRKDAIRDPRETKGKRYRKTEVSGNGACGPGCC